MAVAVVLYRWFHVLSPRAIPHSGCPGARIYETGGGGSILQGIEKRFSALLPTVMKTMFKKPAAPEIPRKWAPHYRRLLALREALTEERAIAESGVSGAMESGGSDAVDRASDESEHDLALGLLGHEENGLAEVNDAIRRIENGCYGVCEETGKRIPAARLRIVPWTRYTKEARERMEERDHGGRPHLAEVFSIRNDPSGGIPEMPESDDSSSANPTVSP